MILIATPINPMRQSYWFFSANEHIVLLIEVAVTTVVIRLAAKKIDERG